jgi:hypothetical protein
MCTRKLWRALGHGGQPPPHAAPSLIPGVALGGWAAKVFRSEGRDLVVALEQRTYLTLAFPLAPRTSFRANFATALGAILSDLGVPDELVQAESAAVDFMPLTRLTDRILTGSLNDIEFHCGIELLYHDDLRRVQRNLNDIPHVNREPCVPVDAVAQLFSTARPSSTWLSH